ncbi:death-associated protein kinase [Mytilus galloprovincialis]|uniref:Death-associated protein kinase n=1 Tax=Mytilus galloprovincialis TaxID=29158 RepID=A0A8B6FGW1_MYTGA|nr:death-associated protein kinase [Mytilus galloprovincialis]
MFVSTRASDYVMECLQDNSCVTLTAPSGAGKSFIARHTALTLQKAGYKIVPVIQPDDIRNYYQPGEQTVFVVDDICGNFTANQQQIDNWKKLLPVVDTIIADKCYSLSRQGDEGKCKKCCLALLVIFNNQLEEKWFQGRITIEQTKIIKDTCEACGMNSIPKAKLKTELDTLVGTFVSKQNGIYRTLHDKLFDFLAYYFGQKIIECLIDHGDSDLVHERFVWQKSTNDETNNIDFMIKIPNDHLESYFQRFIRDWLAGKVAAVFSNNNMKVSSFRQQLIRYLQQLDRSQQKTLANTKDTARPKETCDSGSTSLICTCYDGYTDMVEWLLRNDVNVDQCRDDWASQNGHTDIVKLLLERKPDVNLCNKDGRSPLLQASQEGHTDIVKLLLERNPDVNLCNKDGLSPLLQASQNGHTDIVKLLLERKSDVDLCKKDGVSPLLQASHQGHTDIVKLLLERKPDVDLCKKDGVSPLLQASHQGHTDIVKLLLERKPDVDLCKKDGVSPLFQASHQGHTDIVKLLLERKPDVDLCNNDGVSPLLKASENGHTDIVKLLLERNPDVNLCCKKEFTPLIQASLNGHTDIVRLLLEWNPDPCDNTPLNTSYVNNNISISNSPSLVQSLMKHKPDINAQTYDGGNALYFSAKDGNIEITQLLLENNADSSICIYSKQYIAEMINNHPTGTLGELKQNIFDTHVRSKSSLVTEYVSQKSVDYVFDVVAGSSPLHIACFMGRKDVVNCLLDHNANFNQKKEDGTTPLFYACEVGHEDIVQLLLHKGADSQISRLDGKSPLDITKYNGHTSIELILTEYKKMADQLPV